MKLFTSFLLFLLTTSLFAQREADRDSASIKLGIAVGYYMPDDATANYYNGRDNGRLGFLLEQSQQRNQIRQSLGGYSFSLEEYANDMRYNNAMSFELQLEYEFASNWVISARFHKLSLSASGIFTLRVDRQNQNGTLEPYLEQVNISGKESRSHINLGVGNKFFLKPRLYLLTEAGLDISIVEVKENKILVADRPYTLPTFGSALNPQADNNTNFGSGFYLTTGIGFAFPADIDFVWKATYIRSKINLNREVIESTHVFVPTVGIVKLF